MDDFESVTNSPLSWPAAWKRAKWRRDAPFAKRGAQGDWTVGACMIDLFRELNLMHVERHNVIVSSNVEVRLDGFPRSGKRIPDDPGVAVYFKLSFEPRVLACDKWVKPQHNLRAIVKHIEALRGIDRWGVGTIEQAFTGYAAIPETSGGAGWWEVLGVSDQAMPIEIERAFVDRAMEVHPDRGGNHDEMAALNEARRQALKERA